MSVILRHVVWALLTVTALTGCYNTPVRHLASDAALIRVGESTRTDVLTYLGEPDEQDVLGKGTEKWIYREYERSVVKDAPLVGKYFGKPDWNQVTVILTDNVVTECTYGAWESENDAWADDFGWQEDNGGN
ncbi:MAG: hypothetical protein ACK5PS_02600 [Desulfopila sp.]